MSLRASANPADNASPGAEGTKLTLAMLNGKRFRYSWKSQQGTGDNGVAAFHDDGTVTGINPKYWLIDSQGRLVLKYQDGSVSTIFDNAEQRNGKWFFSGTWLRNRRVENRLEEVGPEEAGASWTQRTAANKPRQTPAEQLKARRTKALSDALAVFQNNDPKTANLVSNILASLNQTGGLTTTDLTQDMGRMRDRVHELVRRGDMESAAALNHAQILTFYSYNFPSQPPHPTRKTGGQAGPGGLVLYLPFDNPDTNGLVHDESGAGNGGQVFGARWVSDGKFGGAYRFSIADFNDRIVIPNSDSLNAEDITVAAWIKATPSTGFFERIFDKDYHHGFALSLSGDWQNQGERGKLLWETGNGTIMGRAADDNQWHHVAAVYDGRMVRCYVDGVESSSKTRKPGPLSRCGWDLCIGNSVVDYDSGELDAFDGLIDEVRIYNRALSTAEIKSLATATQAGADVVSTPDDVRSKSYAATRPGN